MKKPEYTGKGRPGRKEQIRKAIGFLPYDERMDMWMRIMRRAILRNEGLRNER